MIERILVSNFRSLGPDVEVHLGHLTALVGPNGSGKSNVADALRFVAEALRVGLDAAITKRHGIGAMRRWSAGRPFDMSIRLDVRNGSASGFYEFVLGGDGAEDYRVKREVAEHGPLLGAGRFETVEGQWKLGPAGVRPQVDPLGLALPLVAADARFRPLADALRNVAIYSIFPDTLREPRKPDPSRPMDEHGGNWASILKDLRREAELTAALGEVTGDIDDIRVKQVGGYLVTEFRHLQDRVGQGKRKRNKWFDAAQESDGTLRVAGILTALLQEPPLTLVGIEEPELTVHPAVLPLLYDYLQEASRRSQVLITTHSPDLLSLFNANDIRVVERRDGATSVAPMEEAQREAVTGRLLTLGELLQMEGLRQEATEHQT